MTYVLIARCVQTRQLGVAVVGASTAVGGYVPSWSADAGIAVSLGESDPGLARAALERLRAGAEPGAALDDVLSSDRGRDLRQIAITTRGGRSAARTGHRMPDVKGHRVGENWVCIGNQLVGDEVFDVTIETLLAFDDMPLAERLLVALRASERIGGDADHHRAASVVILDGHELPRFDLRIDFAEDPLAELDELYRRALAEDLPGRVRSETSVVDLDDLAHHRTAR